jgi:hypothetical protein
MLITTFAYYVERLDVVYTVQYVKQRNKRHTASSSYHFTMFTLKKKNYFNVIFMHG